MLEFENSFFYNLNKTSKMLFLYLNKQMFDTGFDITVEQLQILMLSYHIDGCSQQEIANILDKDKSGILRSIDVLERKQLVYREPSEVDKRKNKVHPTEAGKKLANEIQLYVLKFENEVIKNIDKKELETTIKVLQKIQDNAKCSQ
ncbi:MAG TPA: MarR family winged helix-turn-helix transcriptional regulator [Bacteroidia bacterium]